MGEINNGELGALIKTYLIDNELLVYGSYDFGDLDKLFGEIYVKNDSILTNGLPENWDNEFKD